MNKLLYLLFLSVFLLDFLHLNLRIIPRFATWMPEIFAMFISLIVILLFAAKKNVFIFNKYIILILVYLAIMFIGIILNAVPIPAIFVGMRVYLKHLPFFLLPAVYDFSDEEFKKQLQFILPLLILQCPLAVYQRLFQYRGVLTGDVVTGTLEGPAQLSSIMICSIAVLFALYLNKKIGFKFFVITACCLFLPTTLNETKSTLVLFPLALILPAFFFQGVMSSKAKSLLTMGLIGVLFISAFVPIYDHFMRPQTGYSILDFVKEGKARSYLYRRSSGEPGEKIGRVDSIVLAWNDLSKDSLTLAFGLGAGNVMGSHFRSLSGDHTEKLQYGAEMLSLTNLFWEIGLLGVTVYVAFFFFLFKDTLLLMRSDDIFSSFALGWSAVVVIIGISLAYKNFIHINVINILFWYFSGIVAAKTFKMKASLENIT